MQDFYYIIKPHGKARRFVIPDIHGCNRTFNHLLWKDIKLTKSDQLFLLGDYIGRGPDSKGVLDTIRYLKKKKYSVFPLLGNHEKDLLNYQDEEFHFLEWHLKQNNMQNLLKENNIRKRYQKILKRLPYYYILDDFILVHAGFDTSKNKPFTDRPAMIQLRTTKYNLKLFDNKIIICGHNPTPLPLIKKQIKEKAKIIKLDNGAVFKGKQKKYIDSSQLGNLLALNLDTFELLKCTNIDF